MVWLLKSVDAASQSIKSKVILIYEQIWLKPCFFELRLVPVTYNLLTRSFFFLKACSRHSDSGVQATHKASPPSPPPPPPKKKQQQQQQQQH